uniref:Uncharacterized protein n=1 Tax=Arion vulgaris TaxID=1028688 RepID=A0A0B7BDD2_9EUPU
MRQFYERNLFGYLRTFVSEQDTAGSIIITWTVCMTDYRAHPAVLSITHT